jgi:hypothetical protein
MRIVRGASRRERAPQRGSLRKTAYVKRKNDALARDGRSSRNHTALSRLGALGGRIEWRGARRHAPRKRK